VGGGSTEISIFIDGKIVEAKSFKIGTLRLLQNKVKSSVWKDIDKWLDKNIKLKTNYQVFGTGGNINKIHKLFGKQFMQPLYLDDLEDLYKSLEPLPIEERIKNYNLKQDRADVIVPALKIYTHCLKHLNAYKIYAPKIGLSDGIIYDLYNKSLTKDQVAPNK
jgi:exopolyphosphatase/guanosine-5'-triphosphate,3'-diphosphate pyrophosphatase